MLPAVVRSRHTLLTKSVRATVALAVTIVALANMIALLAPHPWLQLLTLEQSIDLEAIGAGRVGGLALAGLLLLVSRALMRGKRQAWLISVGLLLFSIGSATVSRSHTGYAILPIALLLALLALAPHFSTKSDPQTLRRGYIALAVCLVCYVGHGVIEAVWDRTLAGDTLHIGFQAKLLLLRALRSTLYLFLGYGVFEVLRPVLRARRLQRDEHRLVESLVRRDGTTTTAHLALGPNLSYYFSASGLTVLAYRLSAGVALILGDPIGSEEEVEPLLLRFLSHCHSQDWTFADYLAGPIVKDICRGLGLAAFKIGEEAVIDVANFTTAGKVGAPIRHAMTRAQRDGMSVQCWHGEPLPDTVFAGMQRVSQMWLLSHGSSTQMGFSMGRFPEDWSERLLTAVAFDQGCVVRAFVTWTPLYRGNGWSLDNMRRMPDAAPGTMDMLIANCLEWGKVHGHARMSLGLAPLAGLDSAEAVQAGMVPPQLRNTCGPSLFERSAAYLYQRKLLLGAYTSLYFFKSKFQPKWEARYLVTTDAAALPRILAALLQVHGYTWRRALREALLPATRYATLRITSVRGAV